MKIIEKVIRWLARNYLKESEWRAYDRGWEDGVSQQRYDPRSTEHYESYDEEGRPWSQTEYWVLGVE